MRSDFIQKHEWIIGFQSWKEYSSEFYEAGCDDACDIIMYCISPFIITNINLQAITKNSDAFKPTINSIAKEYNKLQTCDLHLELLLKHLNCDITLYSEQYTGDISSHIANITKEFMDQCLDKFWETHNCVSESLIDLKNLSKIRCE